MQNFDKIGDGLPSEARVTEPTPSTIRKTAKIFAFLQCLGSVIGIVLFVFGYGPAIVTGRVGPKTALTLILFLLAYALIAWASWRYWRYEHDRKRILRSLLVLQIPYIFVHGIKYGFYSGVQMPIGYLDDRLSFYLRFGANGGLNWDLDPDVFSVAFNIVPVVMILLINYSLRQKNDDSEVRLRQLDVSSFKI